MTEKEEAAESIINNLRQGGAVKDNWKWLEEDAQSYWKKYITKDPTREAFSSFLESIGFDPIYESEYYQKFQEAGLGLLSEERERVIDEIINWSDKADGVISFDDEKCIPHPAIVKYLESLKTPTKEGE